MNDKKKKMAINTSYIPCNHYRKIITASCKVFNQHVIDIIMDYFYVMSLDHGLDGLYRDIHPNYMGYKHCLLLHDNLTFEYESRGFNAKGLYKCFKNKSLQFEGITTHSKLYEKLINFNAKIIYTKNTIQIRSEMPDPSHRKRSDYIIFCKQ